MPPSLVLRRAALRPSTIEALFGNVCRRCFHLTSVRRKDLTIPLSGEVPAFQPSSSKQIDALISRMREYIIVPTLVQARHRDILFNKHQQLRNNPLFIEIDGQNVQLEPLDVAKMPKTSRSLAELINAASTDEDWDNVVRMVQSYHRTQKLRTRNVEHFIRKACETGREHLAMRCLRQVRASGFTLSDPGTLQAALWYVVHNPVAKQDATPEATQQAFKHATQIAEMLSLDKHQASGSISSQLSQQAWVLGSILEAAAAQAKGTEHTQDAEGQVKLYAGRLVSLHKKDAFGTSTSEAVQLAANTANLIKWIPTWYGSRSAQKILQNDELSNGLAAVQRTVESHLLTAFKSNGDGNQQGAMRTARQDRIDMQILRSWQNDAAPE